MELCLGWLVVSDDSHAYTEEGRCMRIQIRIG
jgi:hypothetical protein